MQKDIFLNFIDKHKNDEDFNLRLNDSVFDMYKDEFLGEIQKEEKIIYIFSQLCEELKSKNLLNHETLSSIMDGLFRASVYEKEQYFHKLIYENDQIKKQIYAQGRDIRNSLVDIYKNIENQFKKSNSPYKDMILDVIDERLIGGLEILGILKETSESAFLTTIENGEDVEDTAYEISKNISYLTIKEGKFEKERILNISKVIVKAAIEVANESKIYASSLIKGVINGNKDGIFKSIEKLNDDIKFVPKEINQNLLETTKELQNIENDFIELLKNISLECDEPSKSIIEDILQNSLDSYLAKFIRLTNDTKQLIISKMEDIKENENIEEFAKKANEKMHSLKQEFSKKSLKIFKNLEAQKQELDKFEIENAKKEITLEAKKLGNKVYDGAKSLINHTKESFKRK
ncbi:hypothetical protein CSPB12327_05180 [Campylobacter sp. RM12327]|uniref:hypothetical protein n=1 Tax=Campylobacter sputorum TaxID=206 RepID=UPI000B799268|nr:MULTISPECIES: hypothetical protein [Campylobacter]ASM39427.1 hypothetical protein CSPB_0157 [Campylobacter sputorum]MBE7358239.1 hypothetical protein [Campylobacter sp. RM11302]MBF6669531.1 hypothetical protein [Campylobacter sp. RM12327]MBF6674240.1 hypothetical protein [Campylobacter sp. RM13538]MBF6676024.1 hypothetical protein [Campylobacter sp. RM12321]